MTNAIDMTDETNRRKVRLLTIISGLAIEIRTGMKVSRGVQPLQALKHDFPDFKGNKKKGLKFAIDELKKLDDSYQPSTRILSALE